VGPYWLQSEIHSTFTGDSSFWAAIRLQIEAVLEPLDHAHLYDGHLVREFNRKVITFGFNDLAFSPYDGGFRYMSGDEELIASNIVLDTDSQSVFDSNYNSVLS